MVEDFARLFRTYGDGEYYARRRIAVVHALRDELEHAGRILDLGCGNGRYIAEFQNISHAMMIVGADLGAEMLAEAMARTGKSLPFVRSDASALPFRAERFDFVFASHVLPFVDKLEEAVRGVAQCLSGGGLFVATVGRSGIRATISAVIGDARWARFEPAVFGRISRLSPAMVSEERHREAFESAGLNVEARVAPFSVGWPAVEEWIRLRWMPLATQKEQDSLPRLLEEIAPLCAPHRFDLEERLLLGRKS